MMALPSRQDSSFPSMTVYQLARITYRSWQMYLWDFTGIELQLLQTLRKRSYMIGIQENQRNTLRFLWLKDPYLVNTEVIQLRFCRLVFQLRPSPSILGATLTHHLDVRTR